MLDGVVMLVSVSGSWYYFNVSAWEYITIINWQKLLAVINTEVIYIGIRMASERYYTVI